MTHRIGASTVRLGAALALALALALPPLLATPAAAQLFGNKELEDAVARLERDLARVRSQLQAGDTAGMLRRLSEIEAELARVTGELERLAYRVDTLAADATRRFGDIEYRLTELEGGDLAALPSDPQPLGRGGGAAGGGAGDPGAVSLTEKGDLDAAIRLVQRGNLEGAEAALATFRDTYPNSPLMGEALYWQGEALFTRGEFRAAARSFLAGYNADETGPQAADNLMKLGVSLGRIGKTKEACLTLREVGNRFPGQERAVAEADSEAGRLACG